MTEPSIEGSVSVRSSSPLESELSNNHEMHVNSSEGTNSSVSGRDSKELQQELGELNENTWFEIGIREKL